MHVDHTETTPLRARLQSTTELPVDESVQAFLDKLANRIYSLESEVGRLQANEVILLQELRSVKAKLEELEADKARRLQAVNLEGVSWLDYGQPGTEVGQLDVWDGKGDEEGASDTQHVFKEATELAEEVAAGVAQLRAEEDEWAHMHACRLALQGLVFYALWTASGTTTDALTKANLRTMNSHWWLVECIYGWEDLSKALPPTHAPGVPFYRFIGPTLTAKIHRALDIIAHEQCDRAVAAYRAAEQVSKAGGAKIRRLAGNGIKVGLPRKDSVRTALKRFADEQDVEAVLALLPKSYFFGEYMTDEEMMVELRESLEGPETELGEVEVGNGEGGGDDATDLQENEEMIEAVTKLGAEVAAGTSQMREEQEEWEHLDACRLALQGLVFHAFWTALSTTADALTKADLRVLRLNWLDAESRLEDLSKALPPTDDPSVLFYHFIGPTLTAKIHRALNIIVDKQCARAVAAYRAAEQLSTAAGAKIQRLVFHGIEMGRPLKKSVQTVLKEFADEQDVEAVLELLPKSYFSGEYMTEEEMMAELRESLEDSALPVTDQQLDYACSQEWTEGDDTKVLSGHGALRETEQASVVCCPDNSPPPPSEPANTTGDASQKREISASDVDDAIEAVARLRAEIAGEVARMQAEGLEMERLDACRVGLQGLVLYALQTASSTAGNALSRPDLRALISNWWLVDGGYVWEDLDKALPLTTDDASVAFYRFIGPVLTKKVYDALAVIAHQQCGPAVAAFQAAKRLLSAEGPQVEPLVHNGVELCEPKRDSVRVVLKQFADEEDVEAVLELLPKSSFAGETYSMEETLAELRERLEASGN
ncbi:hypothetical protein RTBOTA2_001784 [Rhodotorula toruloides]|nr:hypothetical protein RTBOTA2_001784 [Rhodotorula toruloides]